MSTPIFPQAVWQSGTNENSIPANDNSLRNEAINRNVISRAVTAQPVSPADGDVYILTTIHTGTQWATFEPDDIVIYRGGTWYAFTPVEGVVINNNGTLYEYSGPSSGWTAISGGGGGSTIGRQSIYIAAGSMRPSENGGCAPLAAVALAANQPDLLTLNFDPGTDEFAEFSFVMPKKWNEGNITYKAHWSHPATTTNFAVVWGLQAVAVGNDDPIGTSYGTAITVTDTGGTTNDLYIADESGDMTVGGSPGPEEMVFFRFYRDANNGADTLAVDARLHGVTLYVTTDADTDA